jgi:hypothetical protein
MSDDGEPVGSAVCALLDNCAQAAQNNSANAAKKTSLNFIAILL